MSNTKDVLPLFNKIVEKYKQTDMVLSGNHLFGWAVMQNMQAVEATIRPTEGAPQRQEARLVMELTVTEEMCQSMGMLHGGCSALLVDNCTTFALLLLDIFKGGKGRLGVSQTINMTYHAPASPGDLLRIVSTTLTLGARSMSARAEIWDATNGRLVASGVHVKMEAATKKDAKL